MLSSVHIHEEEACQWAFHVRGRVVLEGVLFRECIVLECVAPVVSVVPPSPSGKDADVEGPYDTHIDVFNAHGFSAWVERKRNEGEEGRGGEGVTNKKVG